MALALATHKGQSPNSSPTGINALGLFRNIRLTPSFFDAFAVRKTLISIYFWGWIRYKQCEEAFFYPSNFPAG
jgi:hypothetical protein